ncbi:TraR/DksA C4-type zinc finger protein [Candidatus Nomurabacteria bacterium]|nr:TraR/DksA C4-type zinc finger protein [Candidatus Nomurabacteria bacterium]
MKNITVFKEKLEAEKSTLEKELSDIARFNEETGLWEAMPDQDLVGEIDDNDAADRFEDFEERSAILSTLQARLTDVNAALKKIVDDTYGICEIGGEKIEADRLEANPAARTCKEHMNA